MLIADMAPDDVFGRDSVTRIQRAAARMRSLINGLLAYTTARDGGLTRPRSTWTTWCATSPPAGSTTPRAPPR